jgi:hypothetical protein
MTALFLAMLVSGFAGTDATVAFKSVKCEVFSAISYTYTYYSADEGFSILMRVVASF